MISSGQRNGRRGGRRGCGCLPLLGFGVLLLLTVAGYGYYVYQAAWPHLVSGRAHLERALALLQTAPPAALPPESLGTTRADLSAAVADFQAVRAVGGPLLAVAPALGGLPRVGGDVRQAPGLLALAIDGGALGVALIDGVAPAVAQLQRSSAALPAAGSGDRGLAGALTSARPGAPGGKSHDYG